MHVPSHHAVFFDRMHHFATRSDRRMSQQRELLAAAVASVERDGHTIIASGLGQVRPYILIAPGPRLAELVEKRAAAYWMHGCDDRGHYRKGQLINYRSVFVGWTERGH